jgi:metal-dependent amidase/aminoacylase/carboxypeptidase family protein
MHHDSDIAAAYRRNAESLGRTFGPFDPRPTASTDMGNVSLAMPSIHPGIGIDSLRPSTTSSNSPPTASPQRPITPSRTEPSP